MDKPRRLFLIINPKSGTRSKKGLDVRLVGELRDRGFDVSVYETSAAGDATRLANMAVNDGYDGVLACGGDGTVNEVACAMTGTGVPMAIFPAGSGNGLARHLNIPVDPVMAVDIVEQCCIKDCDYGDVNGHPFFCTFGVGFDAAVSQRFAESGTRGRMNYVRSAVQEFFNYQPQTYTIIADGEEITDDALLVAVCNANQYGNNAFIAPGASITDGFLDLVVVKKMPRLNTMLLSMEMLGGTIAENRDVIQRRVRNVVIYRQEPGPAHLDGEPFVISDNRIEVNCHGGQLRLFTNETVEPFRPIITPLHAMFGDMVIALKHLFSK